MGGYILTGAVFIALAAITALLLSGRGANLIAGFNTMSGDEKEQFDKPALCKFTGKVLIPIEAAIFICVIAGMLGAPWSAGFGIAVSICLIPYVISMAVYANTGNRFRKQQ